MRLLIIALGLVATLSAVSCKNHQAHRRENGPPRRYKDTKNKRGIGDYPFGPHYGGPSFQNFQSPPQSSAPSFPQGIPSFGGYGGIGTGAPLGLAPGLIGLPSQASPSFSALGTNLGGIGGFGSLGQPLGSGYGLQSSDINLAGLLGGSSGQGTYSSSGLSFLTSDKNGPVTFSAQSPSAGQLQQSYTPAYASSSPVGSSSYSSPVVFGSSQGSSGHLQPYGQSSSNLGHGLSLTSLTSGGGVTYGSPSSSSSSMSIGDSTAHAVTGSYMIAQPSGSSASYNIPVSALTSSSSTRYALSIPTSSYSSGSSNSGGSGSGSAMPYTSLSGSHPMGGYSMKYSHSPSDGNSYGADPQQSATYGSPTKVAMVSFGNPSSYRGPSGSTSSAYSGGSTGSSYQLSVPNYSSDSSSDSRKQPSTPLTSYGTPAMPYSIPSTSYGTPSSSQYISSSHYNSAPSTGHMIGYASSSPSTGYVSGSLNGYGVSTTGLPYQADSAYKNSGGNYESSNISFMGSSSGGSSSSSSESSSEDNIISNYRIPDSISNSIENYGSQVYTGVGDLSTAYSNLSPRYIRHPAGRTSYATYVEANDFAGSSGSSSSGYDTISYSVPSGKY